MPSTLTREEQRAADLAEYEKSQNGKKIAVIIACAVCLIALIIFLIGIFVKFPFMVNASFMLISATSFIAAVVVGSTLK